KMIFELFRDGNALFVSPEGQILSLLVRERWKDRTLKKGETYTLPPSGMNPVDITLEDFLPAMKNDKQVVAFLAREMSFGGTYAEEVCARAGIEKSTPCNTLPSKDVKLLLNTVKGLLNESITPSIIGEGEKRIDVVPISLKKYTDFSETKFSSFNSALEEYFLSGMNVKEEEKAKKEKMTREKKILVRKKAQEDAIMRRDKEAGSLVRAAELISASYSEYESLILAVREKGIGKAKQVSVKVKSVDNKKKLISIDAGNGTTVELSIEKSLAENINAIYSRSKMLKQKMLRANDALLKTEKLLLEKREEIVMQKTCVREKQQKKEWYQKFRWFRSSNGFLVVGGR
ncbi:MAG: NFACT family protein, partial [Candidatus Aenigmarchaeota archaeon]|nr:NFACT family protein [Candidatus Aenigmarchaeota archaeon]